MCWRPARQNHEGFGNQEERIQKERG
jgi:hypothetical protein